MLEYIDSVEADYYTGKLDYSTATEILDELMEFDAAYDDAAEAGENVYLDNKSGIAFDRAKDYAEEKKWLEAYKELQNIHVKYRLYDEVSSLRTECVTNVRADAIKKMDDYAVSGEIDELIAARDEALMVLPDDKEVIQTSQAHLDAFVTKTLSDAKTLAASDDIDGAIDLLKYAVDMYAHEDFLTAIGEYEYDYAESHCKAMIAQGDLLDAVAYADDLYNLDNDYWPLLEKYGSMLVEDTLAKAKTYADNRDFEEAIRIIGAAQAVYDSAELQDARDSYSDYLPRKLTTFHVIDSENAIIGGTAQDCFGTTYEDILAFDESFSGDKGGFAIFNLDGKFVNLKGVFVGSSALCETVSCAIYADGKLLYESAELGRTSEPVNINVDITGVKQLRVEYMWYRGWDFDPCCIFDLTVS